MDNFYARIIPLKFQSAKEAVSYCRQLAKEYGFTMKQETSSNKVSTFTLSWFDISTFCDNRICCG